MPDETVRRPDGSATSDRTAEYLQKWAESVAYVLGQVAGQTLAIQQTTEPPPETPEEGQSDYQVLVAAAGALRGEMSMRAARSVVITVAQLFLGEPADPGAEFRNEYQEAFEEFLRQVAGYVVTSLKPVWGEVQLRLEPGAPSWSEASAGWLSTARDASIGIRLKCQ